MRIEEILRIKEIVFVTVDSKELRRIRYKLKRVKADYETFPKIVALIAICEIKIRYLEIGGTGNQLYYTRICLENWLRTVFDCVIRLGEKKVVEG